MSRERFGYPFPLTLLLPAVFLSGTAALVYEIVWARHLSLIFGSTTEAVAAVLSSFMLGLALGAVLVGQLADRSRHPLRWAAVLEIGIGVYALSFTSLIEVAGDRLPGPAWIQAFLLLILPCVLMGGTLPVLARAAADSPTRGAKALGALYGVNTLGAVAGAILATFVLLESLGLSGATIFAACINIGLGILFWVASRAAGERTLIEAPDQPSRGLKGSAGTGVLVAFFMAGFAGLTLEVAWVRVLVYYLEGFTIAFGLMLATYLLGLGLGAIGGTALATASKNPRRLLTRILLLEAVLAIFTFILSDRLNEPLESLRSGLGAADAMGAKYAFGLFLASAAIIVPPTLCAGALMPIIARMALCTPQEVGKQAGAVYAAGTLGAVCAPPVAAFLLIPWLGVPGAIAASAALLLWAAWLVALGGSQRDRVTATAVGVLFVVVCLLADLGRPLVEASSVLRNPKYPRHLIEFKEGAHCGVSVVEDLPSGTLALYVDGFRAAETGPKYGYMRMLGHLPVLLHNKPERVLVIAFGTGTTAGAVSVHPEVKEIVCVEIEQGVFDVAHHFEAVNRGVLNSGRATAVVADGREYVRRAGEKFDVITLEPLMPYTPAAVYLYTREFYEAAKERLRPGGILCQWIPIHGESRDDFKRLLKSMDAAFDHVSLWFFEQSAVVLGSKRPPTPDFISLARRCQQPEVAADLRLAFVGDALHLLGSHVAAGERLSKSLKDVEPMTDNRTVLEYRPLPRRFGKRSYRYKAENLEYLRDLHAAEIPWLKEAALVTEAADGYGILLRSLAKEARRRYEGGEVVYAAELAELLDRDPHALFARATTERRAYEELMSRKQYAAASRLTLAPDRSVAFLALAKEASGVERRNTLILALRENAMLPADLLRELAKDLEGEEKTFVQNRINYIEGNPREKGPQRMPQLAVPDLTKLLAAGDADGAREALELARRAGGRSYEAAEDQAKAYADQAEDKVQAAEMLFAAASKHSLAAALRVKAHGSHDDLKRIAPLLCILSLSQWRALCDHEDPDVRDAAAGAAAAHGTTAHLPALAELCADGSEQVRLSAITSFVRIKPEAERIYADYQKLPTKSQLAELHRLAAE